MKLPSIDVPEGKSVALIAAFGSEEEYMRWFKAALRDELRRRIGWAEVSEMTSEIAPEPEPESPARMARSKSAKE